jgi:hypothetical protein
MRRSLQGLAVALQAIASRIQQLRHGPCTDRVPLLRQLLREMTRALAGPSQRRLRIAPRQRGYQTIQLLTQLRVRLGQTLAATTRLAQSRSDFSIGIGISGRQFGQSLAYRVRRHPRRLAHCAHPAPAIGPCFGRRPMSACPFIQHRHKRSVLRLDLLYRGRNLHPALKHISQTLASYFCATPKTLHVAKHPG